VTGADEPQVSWKVLERHAVVVTPDGQEAARVVEVVGDPEADIFGGLVVKTGLLGPDRHLPAEQVRGIWPRRVEVDATAEELERLPRYEQPEGGRILPEGGFFTRVRRLFR
jgi:hypothetical protein